MSASHPAVASPLWRRTRSTRWMDMLSAGCAALALVLLLLPSWPANDTGSPIVQAGVAPVQAAPGTLGGVPPVGRGADSTVAIVVNGNVFSSTRRAPISRFVVPGQATAEMAPSAVPVSLAPGDSAADDGLPRLSAIVAMNGERRALVQFVASDGAARLYGVNEVHAGYRIVRIEADRIILTSQAGTRIVRLSPRATPDSLENLP